MKTNESAKTLASEANLDNAETRVEETKGESKSAWRIKFRTSLRAGGIAHDTPIY